MHEDQDDEDNAHGDQDDEDNAHGGTDHGDRPRPLTLTDRLLGQSTPINVTLINGEIPTGKIINQLDERERRLSYYAAALSVFLGVFTYVAETQNKHFRLAKGQLTPQTTLLWGIGIAVLMVVAIRFNRRAPVAFASFFGFFPFQFVGIPFVILGGWLLFRSQRAQKQLNQLRLQTGKGGRGSTSSRQPRLSAKEQAEARRAEKKSGAAKGSTSGKPQANKRYTPKAPTRTTPAPPPPKQSWLERRAAKSEQQQ